MNELNAAIEQGRDYIQFYKAGFIDGYEVNKKIKEKNIEKINELCKKRFEVRFANKLQGKIKARKMSKTEFELRAKMVKDFNEKGSYDKKDLIKLNEYRGLKNGS